MSVLHDSIPIELRSRSQWMKWNYTHDGRKIPFGKSNDPTTWTTFDALADQDRIGFVISGQDPFCGVDLDGCIVDGQFTDWSLPILEQFRGVAYGEVSPSGNGVKFITIARKPEGCRCTCKMGEGKQQIECYDHERFWTVTGNVGPGFETIGNGQEAVDLLCRTYLSKQLLPSKPSSASLMLLPRAQAYADKMSPGDKGDLRNAAFRNAGSLHAFVGENGERLSDNEVYCLLRSWNARNATQLRDDELLEASRNGRKNGTPPVDKMPKLMEATSHLDDFVNKLTGEAPHTTADATPKPTFTTPAIVILDRYVNDLMEGKVAQLTKLGSELNGIEIGPGLLSVFGAPPGFGKTCLSMQIAFEALEYDPNLVVTIANAETTFDGLLRREFTRITGINSRKIRFGNLNDDERRQIREVAKALRPAAQRTSVIEECTMASLMILGREQPGLVVVDYLQKFAPPGDARLGVNAVMTQCRYLAKKGWAVIALSATARTNGKGGSGHDSSQLNQASYRESGDIEFNADSCYLLVDQGPKNGCDFERSTLLKHVKNRHDTKDDRELIFNMRRQRFESAIDIDSITCHRDVAMFNGANNAFGNDDDE